MAQIIHELSNRARFSFIKVNCAAIPGNVLESELFGYEKGAFTWASESKIGLFEEADGGTIFLDEIGEVPTLLQAKLLRFVQDREFERLGSTKTKTVDVRIIAATSRDLSRAVGDGYFQEGLYYRLNVFTIRVPPLRERTEDIAPLINFFSEKIGREYTRSLKFTDAALDLLLRYSWPGNVREVENFIERLAITFYGEIIDVRDLAPYLTYTTNDLEIRRWQRSLSEQEKRDVVEALERNNWIQSHAAKELGITLRQMGYRVKKLGLTDIVRQRKNLALRVSAYHTC